MFYYLYFVNISCCTQVIKLFYKIRLFCFWNENNEMC